MKLRLILLLLLVCALHPGAVVNGQNEDVLARADDDSAATLAERQRALTTLLTAAHQLSATGATLQAARYMNRAGRLQLRLSQPQEARATYQAALALLAQAPDPGTKIDSLNGLGAAYNYASKCDKAQPLLQRAITLSEQSAYVAGKAEALLTLSDCQNFGNHALALSSAQTALALWRSVNNKRGIALAYAAMGQYQLAQNDLPAATASHEAALNLWRELNVADEQAEALINLGFIEFRKGAWQYSLSFYTQAQGLLDEQAEPFKMGQITAGLGESFIESGLPDVGLVKLRQSLAYFQQAKNPRAEIVLGWDIGRTQYILGDYAAALTSLQNALAAAEAIKEPAVRAFCHDYLGRTYVARNDPATALSHYQAALNLYTQIGKTMEAARIEALLGQVYEQQGQAERARRSYERALTTFRALADHVNESATLYVRGRLELQQNHLDRAEADLRQSLDVTENIRRVSTSGDLMAAFSATVHERYEGYIECLMRKQQAQPTQGFAARAFAISELTRARSLAELLRATQTNFAPGIDLQLAEREKSLRQLLRVQEDNKVELLAQAYKRKDLTALETELARLETEYRQVTDTIRARYPAYEQMTRPAAWDLRRIQEQVIADDQTILLEYSLGVNRSYVWAVTRASLTSYELPAQAQIKAAAQRVYQALAAPPDTATAADLTTAARDLSQMILSPVATELNKRRIIVVADDALNYIPFQVLPAPSGVNEPLVVNYEIVNAPSASILGDLRQEAAQRQPAKVLAAFGDPVFASNYAQRRGASDGGQLVAMQTLEPASLYHVLRDLELNGDEFDPSVIKPLFYAGRELANLRGVAAGDKTFVAVGADATRAQLLNTDLTQYAILHFATHGFLDPKRPEKSGLVLSTVDRDGHEQNGFVGLQDIYGLRAPVDLVVLSACRTALGKDVRGEGLLSLTRGFMYAGASSVVASLWKVDDEATAELMRQFYSEMLQAGLPPAAALRAAQNRIRQNPDWHAPYYWAAFTLQGEYRHVIKPAAPAPATVGVTWARKRIMGGGVLLTLLVGGAWWYRRRKLRLK